MATARTIDVQEFINAHPLSRSQRWVIAFCFLVVAIDGFDTAAVGFIAPALRAAWGLAPAQLAPLFGAGLFGLMIGAFVFGPLADNPQRVGAALRAPFLGRHRARRGEYRRPPRAAPDGLPAAREWPLPWPCCRPPPAA